MPKPRYFVIGGAGSPHGLIDKAARHGEVLRSVLAPGGSPITYGVVEVAPNELAVARAEMQRGFGRRR